MRQINKNQWDKIISDAFSPDAPEPKFSKIITAEKKKFSVRLNIQQKGVSL